VRKTSHASSLPPSSDGLAKKTRSLREASGKPPGGRPGHKGTALKQADRPAQTLNHPPLEQCNRCR
jgi:transposase